MNFQTLFFKKIILIFVSYFFFSPFLSAECIPIDSTKIQQLYNKYNQSRIWKKNLPLALAKLDTLDNLASKLGCVKFAFEVGMSRANALSYNDKVLEMFEELTRLNVFVARNKQHLNEQKSSFILNYTWGRYYSILGNFQLAESSYLDALNNLDNLKQQGDGFEPYRAPTLRQIGLSLSALGRIAESIKYQELGLALETKPIRKSLNLKHIGQAYKQLKNYTVTEEYYDEAYDILQNLFKGDADLRIKNKNNMIALLNDYARLYIEMAESLNNNNYFAKAESYLNESLTFHKNLIDDQKLQETYRLFGDLKFKIKQFTQAESYYQKAKKVAASDWESSKNLIQLAKIYEGEKDLSKAADTLQFAVRLLEGNLAIDEENSEKLLPDLVYLEAITQYAKVLYQKAIQENKNTKGLNDAWDAAKTGAKAIENILTVFESFDDKEALIDRSYDLFETAIAISHALWEETNDETYTFAAFAFAEQSKAIVLKSAVSRTFTSQLDIPESYRQKHLGYQSRLNSIDEKLKRLKRKKNDKGDKYTRLLTQYLSTQDDYQAFLKDSLSAFPKYAKLVSQDFPTTVNSIQNLIGSERTILEYFIGQHQSFAFILKNTGIEMLKFDFKKETLETVADKFIKCNEMPEDADCLSTWPEKSHALYQLIFAPAADKLTKNLTIIPDGVLCYVPFSTLLSSYDVNLKQSKIPYATLNYLLKDYIINYNYSVYLCLDDSVDQNNKNSVQFTGFAPSFEISSSITATLGNTKMGLKPIANSPALIKRISELFGQNQCQLFAKDQGTKHNFLQHAANSRIIHLHTHGVFDEKNSDESFLAFYQANQVNADSNLYMRDMYGMDLQAEVITLPACHSGYGKTLRGQGLISMARGFYYAGAKSVFPSLWEGNNLSMSEISQLFYQHLAAGQDKNLAMQQAKIQYLKAHPNDLSAYPFYWGAYIPISKIKPASSSFSFKYIGLFGGLLLVLFLIFRRKKHHQSNAS